MRTSSLASSGFLVGTLVLGLSAAACGVVSSGFASEEGAPRSATGGRTDEAIQDETDGGNSLAAPPDGSARGGHPLCGDPAASECWPDDPRQAPVCGNVVPPLEDGGDGGSGGSGEEDEGDDGGDPLEDAGPAAQPEACRVRRTEAGQLVNLCGTAGNGGEGALCTVGMECGAGLDCVQDPRSSAGEGTCRAYCCGGVCAGAVNGGGEGRFCDPAVRVADAARVPACLPIRSCRLLGKDECSVNETCAVVREIDGSTGCVEVGTAAAGAACDIEHCAAGLTCLGQVGSRTCFQLCSDAGVTCPIGQECTWAPPAFRESGVGVCTESTNQRVY